MYIDKLEDIVNEYNNTYPRTIKMKPADVKDNAYIDFSEEVNDKDSKFKEVKNIVPWTYVISDLDDDEIIGTFYETELQKTNQQTFRIEKVIKTKENKVYVKWRE